MANITGYKGKFLGSSAVRGTYMSALIQLAQMKIQLALVQKQLVFWTQLAHLATGLMNYWLNELQHIPCVHNNFDGNRAECVQQEISSVHQGVFSSVQVFRLA